MLPIELMQLAFVHLKKYDNLDKNFKNDLEILYKIEKIEKETLDFYDKNKKINNG